ncbi:helix-turn-helix transcriptional regulator [Streptomyces sp. PTM05]|uniref:Helix-turn-helix transcriptional regulator n=1 Tax=Streptantibioticus parmotrematis TaxID=2873249 RepID=A0ABS7QVF9_9ACTN|nr:helix-turn-helix transcriptional regulator [Streptantibioticus parmotrematis]MBY8885764.1 helix-turn-helix transcriptional regulator [Streptantibioticus parmotrematis]
MAQRPRELTPFVSARHLFGAELRRHREQAGLSLERLAAIVKYSRSHLSRIEIAEVMPPPDLAELLDAAFGTDGIFGKVYELAKREVHPDQYRRLMELEARAREIEEYGGQLVPGLVQTEDYARALFRVSNPAASPEAIEEKVAARMSRQALLRAEPPPHLSVILDEAAVRRPVGGPQVMRTQLAALIEIVDTPTSVVQVLPFDHGEHALAGGSLKLVTLEDRTAVAYEESIGTGTLIEDSDTVSAHRRVYDLLRAYALSPSRTATFIGSVMEALPS